MLSSFQRITVSILVALAASACQSNGAFLVFGGSEAPHQDLVHRVGGAENESVRAKDDYREAFDLYQRLTSPQSVELGELSDDFEKAVKGCERREQDLAERIEAIRKEGDKLVDGWNEELTRFSGETMRKKSEAMLRDTEARGQRVLTALERVQSRMKPVLFKLQDYALFFHHNLNARAIATLQDTYKDFDAEFRALESELARAQSEIAAFLANYVEPEPVAPAN